ncbi:hypothetical protein [Pseudomonas sp.]|uniref:hypothetical protein n=1 Tax=Pseudomonas sp. TaxID=306 RepID=UPI0026057BEF|nr:hypothetical protein [Pseudomonas sp.]
MSSNPVAPNANPAAITIAEALDNATGTIPANLATVGITFECKTGDLTDYDDWFEVELMDLQAISPVWRKVAGPEQLSATPIPIPDRFNILYAPPPGGFRHGFFETRSLQYRDFGGFPGGAADISNPGRLTWDLVPPYADLIFREQPNAVIFPTNLPATAFIDDAYLTTHGGVMFQIPDNSFVQPPGQWQAGDFIIFYWSPVMFPRPQDIVSPPGGIPMLQTGNTFFLPRASIDMSGDYSAFYVIVDRAGNVSRPSFIEQREVKLIADPVPGEPYLPLAPAPEGASTDDLIDIADWLLDPEIWVTSYANHSPTLDRLEVQVGTQAWSGLGAIFDTFPQIFNGMKAQFEASYTQTTIGPQSVIVRYRISRNGILYDSSQKTIRLDLSVAGPENPGGPGTPNPNLNQAHVFGEGSTTPDVLLPEHADKQVRVDIVLWTTPAPHSGLSIIFLWENERVGTFPIGSAVGGSTFSFNIDWDVVARHGNNIKKIKYLVIDPSATTNENESPHTDVDVRDAVSVILAKAEFLNRNAANNRWDCSSMKERTPVIPGSPPVLYGEIYVPGDSSMALNGSLTLVLTLNNTYSNFPPGPFPKTLTHSNITQDDIDHGITFEIDYKGYLDKAPLGNCDANYSTVLNNGVTGRGELSNTRVALGTTHVFCDGTPVPAPRG